MSERKQLIQSLKECMEWMESLRSSGDAGNWEWDEDDAYTKSEALLKKIRDAENSKGTKVPGQ